MEAGAAGREGGEVGTRLLSFSHPVAWDIGSGGIKSNLLIATRGRWQQEHPQPRSP